MIKMLNVNIELLVTTFNQDLTQTEMSGPVIG